MMKRIFCFVAAAAMISLTSCRQEELEGGIVNDNSAGIADNPVFTASISETKTVVNVSDGKVSWESDDKISVSDAAGHTALYGITDIDETTGRATFVCKSGDSLDPNSSYTATYGTVPSKDQTYSAQAGKLYMTAPATTTGSFSFSVQCGLLKLTLTKAGESIKRIAVTGTPTGGGKTTYTLSCSTPIDISEGTDFYIALPGGTYSKFVLKNASDCICSLNATNGIAVSVNGIKPVSLSTKIAFYPVPEGALSGEFSVADGRRVRFSKGNLQYQASTGTWRFAEHQYDIIGDNPGNNTETGRESQSEWIDLFGWGATGLNPNGEQPYSTHTGWGEYKTGDTARSGELLTRENGGDWGVCMGEGWRMLSSEEWSYISNRGKLHRAYIIMEGGQTLYGLVIAPDNYTPVFTNPDAFNSTYAWCDWLRDEAAGCVFLPAAGYRNGKTMNDIGNAGCYWAPEDWGPYDARRLKFDSMYLEATGFFGRASGQSVRLVSDLTVGSVTVLETKNGTVTAGSSSAKVGSTVTFTASPDNGYEIGSILVRDVSGSSVEVSGTNGSYSYIQPVSSSTISVSFVKEGPLAGYFSVGADKRVLFSCGNLYWDGSKWNMEANQYDFRHYNGHTYDFANVNGIKTTTPSGTVGSFYWSKNPDCARSEAYSDPGASRGDVIFTNNPDDYEKFNPSFTVSGKTGFWRVPTTAEWSYLFNTRGTGDTYFKCGVTVLGNEGCLVIAPDGNSTPIADSYDKESWDAAEEAGFVCLMAAGGRTGGSIIDVNPITHGYYISSEPDVDAGDSRRLDFFGNTIYYFYGSDRSIAFSLRLVACQYKVKTHKTYGSFDIDREFFFPGEEVTIKNVSPHEKCTLRVIDRENADLTITNLGNGSYKFIMPEVPVTVACMPIGTLTGAFSVSADKKVYFSKGNLQYQASTNTWKFADHQHDFIGDAAGNNTADENVRAGQSGWIDLFGWGATGLNAVNMPPYSISTEWSQYSDAVVGDNLTRDNGGEWGACVGEGWRTLSLTEWFYLPDHGKVRKISITLADGVNNISGLIIAPDNYTLKDSGTYSLDDWKAAEAAGCVFLPAAGYREGSSVQNVGNHTMYWSSSRQRGYGCADAFHHSGSYFDRIDISYSVGLAVRLVADVE